MFQKLAEKFLVQPERGDTSVCWLFCSSILFPEALDQVGFETLWLAVVVLVWSCGAAENSYKHT